MFIVLPKILHPALTTRERGIAIIRYSLFMLLQFYFYATAHCHRWSSAKGYSYKKVDDVILILL